MTNVKCPDHQVAVSHDGYFRRLRNKGAEQKRQEYKEGCPSHVGNIKAAASSCQRKVSILRCPVFERLTVLIFNGIF
jgi:hypothetical protein